MRIKILLHYTYFKETMTKQLKADRAANLYRAIGDDGVNLPYLLFNLLTSWKRKIE
jgi:hypothetical protein